MTHLDKHTHTLKEHPERGRHHRFFVRDVKHAAIGALQLQLRATAAVAVIVARCLALCRRRLLCWLRLCCCCRCGCAVLRRCGEFAFPVLLFLAQRRNRVYCTRSCGSCAHPHSHICSSPATTQTSKRAHKSPSLLRRKNARSSLDLLRFMALDADSTHLLFLASCSVALASFVVFLLVVRCFLREATEFSIKQASKHTNPRP